MRSVQSEYQTLLQYYKDIQAAALRTYITAQLSYMILHLHESGNFREQSIAYQEQFVKLNAEIQNVFRPKLKAASKYVFACDPLFDATGNVNLFVSHTSSHIKLLILFSIL